MRRSAASFPAWGKSYHAMVDRSSTAESLRVGGWTFCLPATADEQELGQAGRDHQSYLLIGHTIAAQPHGGRAQASSMMHNVACRWHRLNSLPACIRNGGPITWKARSTLLPDPTCPLPPSQHSLCRYKPKLDFSLPGRLLNVIADPNLNLLE
jgi:hypothetical protein